MVEKRQRQLRISHSNKSTWWAILFLIYPLLNQKVSSRWILASNDACLIIMWVKADSGSFSLWSKGLSISIYSLVFSIYSLAVAWPVFGSYSLTSLLQPSQPPWRNVVLLQYLLQCRLQIPPPGHGFLVPFFPRRWREWQLTCRLHGFLTPWRLLSDCPCGTWPSGGVWMCACHMNPGPSNERVVGRLDIQFEYWKLRADIHRQIYLSFSAGSIKCSDYHGGLPHVGYINRQLVQGGSWTKKKGPNHYQSKPCYNHLLAPFTHSRKEHTRKQVAITRPSCSSPLLMHQKNLLFWL